MSDRLRAQSKTSAGSTGTLALSSRGNSPMQGDGKSADALAAAGPCASASAAGQADAVRASLIASATGINEQGRAGDEIGNHGNYTTTKHPHRRSHGEAQGVTALSLRLEQGMTAREARRVLNAPRRSDALNEDEYDFAVVVRVALDAAQQRALQEAKRRADAIAHASVSAVGAETALPGLSRMMGASDAATHVASPAPTSGQSSPLHQRRRADGPHRREAHHGGRAGTVDGAATEDSASASDSASVSDSDALSDSEDDFFGSSDSDIDVKDAGRHGKRFGPVRKRFPRQSLLARRSDGAAALAAANTPASRAVAVAGGSAASAPSPAAIDPSAAAPAPQATPSAKKPGMARITKTQQGSAPAPQPGAAQQESSVAGAPTRPNDARRRRSVAFLRSRNGSAGRAGAVDAAEGARHKCQEILEALRRAGLRAKRVRSLNRSKWLIKVRAPEWRLEEEAERLRLRMRRRDGGWSKFRRSLRHAFGVPVPWEEQEQDGELDARRGQAQAVATLAEMGAGSARRSLFHSSDRQTLIHHILRSSTREGGAELGSHTPLGAFVVQMFPLHMQARLGALRNDWLAIWRPKASVPELDRIGHSARAGAGAAYFGETVAFYFAWLEFYTQWLVFPAVIGTCLFAAQVWYGTVDITWVPLFSLFMALWSTLFLEFWKRRNAELAHRWGVLNYEHEEVTRPQFRGEWRTDAVTGEVFRVYPAWRRLLKYVVTAPVVVACTAAVIIFMILLFTTRDAILIGIQQAACERGDIPPTAALCSGEGASAMWQPAVDWGILAAAPVSTVAAPPNPGGNSTARLLGFGAPAAHAGPAMTLPGLFTAGSTVTAVLGQTAGNAAVRATIGGSARVLHAAISAGKAVAVEAGGAVSSWVGDAFAVAAVSRNLARSTGTFNTTGGGNTGSGLGETLGSLSSLGVESFDEWISQSGDVEWWLAMLLPPVAYGFLIPVFDFAFGRLALRFTDWENHKTESLFRNHRIAKVFVFRFVNSFISLFYYAFSPSSSLLQLTVQLASFLLAGQLWNTILEVVFPCAWRKYKACRFRQRVRRAVDSGLTEGRRGRRLLRHANAQAWKESRLAEYDTFNDYAEMQIQFGYVTFFSWAFPLAPLCSLVNNVMEMRTDAYKLLYNTQRPIAYKAGGIGVWLSVLQGMSLLAVLTNCAHLALASRQFSVYFPTLTDAQKMLVVFLLEHAVLGLKLLLGSIIPHTSESVQKRVARDNFYLARLQGRRSMS